MPRDWLIEIVISRGRVGVAADRVLES